MLETSSIKKKETKEIRENFILHDFMASQNRLGQFDPGGQLSTPTNGDQCSYLKDVQLHDIDGCVDLLFGAVTPKVMEPQELIIGQDDGTYVVRTRVSWVIKCSLCAGNSRNRSE